MKENIAQPTILTSSAGMLVDGKNSSHRVGRASPESVAKLYQKTHHGVEDVEMFHLTICTGI